MKWKLWWWSSNLAWGLPSLKLTYFLEIGRAPTGNFIFQPSMFRGEDVSFKDVSIGGRSTTSPRKQEASCPPPEVHLRQRLEHQRLAESSRTLWKWGPPIFMAGKKPTDHWFPLIRPAIQPLFLGWGVRHGGIGWLAIKFFILFNKKGGREVLKRSWAGCNISGRLHETWLLHFFLLVRKEDWKLQSTHPYCCPYSSKIKKDWCSKSERNIFQPQHHWRLLNSI